MQYLERWNIITDLACTAHLVSPSPTVSVLASGMMQHSTSTAHRQRRLSENTRHGRHCSCGVCGAHCRNVMEGDDDDLSRRRPEEAFATGSVVERRRRCGWRCVWPLFWRVCLLPQPAVPVACSERATERERRISGRRIDVGEPQPWRAASGCGGAKFGAGAGQALRRRVLSQADVIGGVQIS